MLKISSVLPILFIVQVSGVKIPFLLDMQELLDTSNIIKSLADENLPVENLLSNSPQLNEVMELIDNLTARIVGFEYQFIYQLGVLGNEFKFDKDNLRSFRKVILPMGNIDYIYEDLLDAIDKITNFDEETLQKLLNNLSSDGSASVQQYLSQLYERVLPPNDYTYWETLQMYREGMTTSIACDMKESYQYIVYRLYGVAILSELKGLAVNMYLFKAFSSSMNVAFTDLVERAQGDFVRRTNQYLQAIQKVMPKISREFYLCDSTDYHLGEDYLELEGLFTAYVINENEVGTFTDTCVGGCQNLRSILHRRCYNNNGQEFCTDHKCFGLIHDCQKIGGRVDLCEENPSSFKRYRYVKSSDKNKLYGKWSDCKNGKYGRLDTFWYRDNQCDVCMCQCSQKSAVSKAIRAFSLRPQISNINENKVVSNFRFVLKNNLIHIQIEESPLQEYGHINRESLSWVPLEEFKSLYNSSQGGFAIINNNGSITLTEDIDFAIVSKVSPLINLDEISAGPYYVLTGVRLNREEASTYEFETNLSPIQLEIHVTPFDFASGQLNPTDDNPSIWLTSKTQPNPPPEYSQRRQENKLGGYVYKYEKAENIPDVRPNRFVKFQQSSIDSDAGQSTIPFLDARPALDKDINSNTMGFSGAGIIHRKNNKFAGLLALKALTIDLSNHIDTNISEDQMNYYEQLPPLPLTYDELNSQ